MALAFSSTPLAPTELEDATTCPTTYDIGDLLPLSTSRPATSLFGLSSSRPATSLFGLSMLAAVARPRLSPAPAALARPRLSSVSAALARPRLSSASAAPARPRLLLQPQLALRSQPPMMSSLQRTSFSWRCTPPLSVLYSVLLSLSLNNLCVFFFVYCSLLCLHFVSFFFIQTHWRGSIVVFLPRTLHTNSIYNFCTFVLSYFIFIVLIQRILIHARTFFHFRLAQAPEQSTWLFFSLHRLPAFLLVATSLSHLLSLLINFFVRWSLFHHAVVTVIT